MANLGRTLALLDDSPGAVSTKVVLGASQRIAVSKGHYHPLFVFAHKAGSHNQVVAFLDTGLSRALQNLHASACVGWQIYKGYAGAGWCILFGFEERTRQQNLLTI